MKSCDLKSIQSIDTKNHYYLKIEGKGDQQHLAVCKRNWCGRLLMWMGLNSSSMKKIAAYVAKNKEAFQASDLDALAPLKEKLSRYHHHHKKIKVVKTALEIFAKIKPIESKPAPMTEEIKPPKENPVPSGPELKPLEKKPDLAKEELKNQINIFNRQFIKSAPEMERLPDWSVDKKGFEAAKDKNDAIMKGEIDKLAHFFKSEPLDTHTTLYVCIGAGQSADQVWPGFVYDALLKKQESIKTLLFENIDQKFDTKVSHFEMFSAIARVFLKNHPSPSAPDLNGVNKNYKIHQFLCGLPDMVGTQDAIDPKTYKMVANTYWPQAKEKEEMWQAFKGYIRKELEAGKQVVLGDHRGPIDVEQPLVAYYNELVLEFPGKVHFMWAWLKVNVITSQVIKEEDCNPIKDSEFWTYHKELLDCTI